MAQYADEALYIRMRLLRLHEMNRIVYDKKTWAKMERCLIAQTSEDKVATRLERILPETMTTEFAREMEYALVDAHGLERYAGKPELLHEDIERASVRFRVNTLRDEIYFSCGHILENSRKERMDDAAWFAVAERERGGKDKG